MGAELPVVNSYNEWDPLEEIIVGIVDGARLPRPDPGFHALEFADLADARQIPSGPFSTRVLEETAEDLDQLAEAMTRLGVVVRRPEPMDHSRVFASPDWESDGFFNYCPRDTLLVLGSTIVETPMVLRARAGATCSTWCPTAAIVLEPDGSPLPWARSTACTCASG